MVGVGVATGSTDVAEGGVEVGVAVASGPGVATVVVVRAGNGDIPGVAVARGVSPGCFPTKTGTAMGRTERDGVGGPTVSGGGVGVGPGPLQAISNARNSNMGIPRETLNNSGGLWHSRVKESRG